MNNSNSSKRKRDFAHTVSVLLSSALVEHDMRHETANAQRVGRSFDFELLAAASQARQLIPAEGLLAQGGELIVTLQEKPEELWVQLQATGYASLTQCASHDARLVSRNGAIDYRTRFNIHGTATCVLSDLPEIREGLCDFSVEILIE